jgi:hypothetical protein
VVVAPRRRRHVHGGGVAELLEEGAGQAAFNILNCQPSVSVYSQQFLATQECPLEPGPPSHRWLRAN